jgi:hypothetical protein
LGPEQNLEQDARLPRLGGGGNGFRGWRILEQALGDWCFWLIAANGLNLWDRWVDGIHGVSFEKSAFPLGRFYRGDGIKGIT